MVMMRIVVCFLSLACLSLASSSPPATSTAGTTTPFCGVSCCCSDDLKLREAFLGEVKAHGYHDAECRSQLKAYLCAVCLAAAHNDTPSALPLRCAGAAAPPPSTVSTTSHDDELGSPSSSTLCVHRASTQAYDGVVPLHDGSGRLLCWRRNGQIWLATVDVVDPTGGSVLRVSDRPVVDLGRRVNQDAAARGGGLAGVAVHSSSRLYVSYYAAASRLSISTTRHDNDLGGGSSSSTLCVQQASTQAFDGVVPLHDGSGRLLCWRRNGQIWLATVDGSVLRVGASPVIDLGTHVSQEAAARGLGLAGVAVDYSTGRPFVSYYTTHDGGDFLVVDELSTVSSWSEREAQARNTRVLSMALPAQGEGFLRDYYGGQILFRPTDADSFLYLVTGLAQSDAQLQAKILRFRVGGMPAGIGSMEVQVYASVLGIPRRCAFDADKPHDLYCAIAKEDEEVIYLISDGSSISATQPSASLVVAHQRPTPGRPPSIVGGLLYRGYADNTLIGSYTFMEGKEFWWTVTSPAGNYTTTRNLRVTCAAPATATPRCRGGVDFAGGSVISFAEDADKNALFLAADGVYMVVQPSLCDADTHTDTYKSVLKGIFGFIGSLIAILGGGYGAYRTCICFGRRNDITVNATNVSIHNGDNEIELTVISTER